MGFGSVAKLLIGRPIAATYKFDKIGYSWEASKEPAGNRLRWSAPLHAFEHLSFEREK
jgi:hypothetical protein